MARHPDENVRRTCDGSRRTAIIVVVIQLLLSCTGFCVGVTAYTATGNVKAGAFWPHTALIASSVLFLVGCYKGRDGNSWLIAGYIFCGLGIFMAFVGCIVEGVQGTHVKETSFDSCSYSKDSGVANCEGNDFISRILSKTCFASYPKRSCYCCYLYKTQNCQLLSFSLSTMPSIYEDVSSCDFVQTTYQRLMWTSMCLCLFNTVLGVITCVCISLFKSYTQRMISPGMVLSAGNQLHAPVIFYTSPNQGYFRQPGPQYTVPAPVWAPPPYQDPAVIEPSINRATVDGDPDPAGPSSDTNEGGGPEWYDPGEKPPPYSVVA